MAPDNTRPSTGGADPGNYNYPPGSQLRETAEREIAGNQFSSMDALLREAYQSLQQVPSNVEFRRPDRAYIEGRKCDTLILLLARHRDFPTLTEEKRSNLSRLVKQRDAQLPMHRAMDAAIKRNDMARSSVGSDVVSSAPRFTDSTTHSKRDDLHLSNGDDPLLKRFSALRTSEAKLPYPTQDPRPVGLPASPRPPVNGAFIPLSSVNSAPARPVGPREMPSVPTALPFVPPKVMTHGRAPSLPRPAPIYAPGRGVESPTTVTPPRLDNRSASAMGINNPPAYNPLPPSGYSRPPSRDVVSSKPDLPYTTSITPQELYDRLRIYNILVIDVRARESFDEGHLFCKNIICIEPVRLTYGMSFDDMRDTLLYSSDLELYMFDNIIDYDLVVYYDQDSSESFLSGNPKTASSPWLRALYETLVTFNDRVPLRRPPVVLSGGLDAWIDLMGPQSLRTSNTMQISKPLNNRKPSKRMPHRPSITGGTSSREVRMRRLQQYDPLNETEKRSWQEQLRQEEVKPADLRAFETKATVDEVEEDEPVSPAYHRSVDEFLRRYPEAPAVPVSMVKPIQDQRSQLAPQRPPIPTIPSRPAPAVSRPSYGGVSERGPNAAGVVAQQAAQQPLYRPRQFNTIYRLPRTGLVNYGVTCYMNSTIQCLSATMELAMFFLRETWKGQVQVNWKGSEGILPGVFSNLIRSLWIPEASALRPKTLRAICGRMNPQWAMDRQQDAQEFLMFLLDCLHEDLNINFNRNALTPLSEEQEFAREQLPIWRVSKIEHDRYKHRESSTISDLFSGQHASRLTCLSCRRTSTSYEAFYSLSLEIPQSGFCKITDCLANYTKEEQLEAGEEWKCPYCKVPRAATKRLQITRLPHILAITFKRFSGSMSGKTRKISTAIDFPLYGLDMRPCMANTQFPVEEDEAMSRDPATTPPFTYDAYAVTRHIGNSLESGHYIALVRDAARATWVRFDDDRVMDFDPTKLRFEDRLQNEQAYIVFYERSRAR